MRRFFACAAVTLSSGCAAFFAAALLGLVAAIATPFVADFPIPDPPDSTDYGRGILMVVVAFIVATFSLIPLWIVCYKFLWRKCDADSFIENGFAQGEPTG